MAIHKLTPRKVATARPGKYEDGGGLRLVVAASGTKKWVLRFTLHGTRHEMGLGGYPAIGLAQARDEAAVFRLEARRGINPLHSRRLALSQAPTFTTCAARYIRAHRHGWKNAKHGRQWIATLKTYARPVIGHQPVDAITTDDVLQILSPIWSRKTETAKRVQGRIENILDYAAAHNFRDPLNPARWRGHLDKLLPRPSRVKRVVHHPAMPCLAVPAFLVELEQSPSVSAWALQFLILTATRTSEVLHAQWQEIDLAAAVWTIPAERMKAGREHRVPLSDRALDVLGSVPRVTGNTYVFPGPRRGAPLSSMALLQLMRGLGYGVAGDRGPYVPHGFRASFREWSGEIASFPRDVAEMALAHVIQNKAEAAYRRGDLFAKRCRMMQAWADFLGKEASIPLTLPVRSAPETAETRVGLERDLHR